MKNTELIILILILVALILLLRLIKYIPANINPPGPKPNIGGCKGTQFGCCDDGITVCSDYECSNCLLDATPGLGSYNSGDLGNIKYIGTEYSSQVSSEGSNLETVLKGIKQEYGVGSNEYKIALDMAQDTDLETIQDVKHKNALDMSQDKGSETIQDVKHKIALDMSQDTDLETILNDVKQEYGAESNEYKTALDLSQKFLEEEEQEEQEEEQEEEKEEEEEEELVAILRGKWQGDRGKRGPPGERGKRGPRGNPGATVQPTLENNINIINRLFQIMKNFKGF